MSSLWGWGERRGGYQPQDKISFCCTVGFGTITAVSCCPTMNTSNRAVTTTAWGHFIPMQWGWWHSNQKEQPLCSCQAANGVHIPHASPGKDPKTPSVCPRSNAPAALPVGREDVERRGLVAALVHLHHRVGDGVARHNLLVLHRGALECFPHVDVLQ